MIRWSAMLGALEALENGTTAIVDHHESPNAIEGSLDVIAEACAEVGVRSLLAYGITDRHGPDGARRGLAENERFIRAGGRGLVGIHAAFTCSDASLHAAAGLAEDLGVGVHVHVCEGIGDVDAPRRLAGLTRDDWLLAHCVHLPTDHALRGTILHNPMSNLNNAVGYANPARFANPVALGTDGIGGNVLEAFRLAYVLQRSVDVTCGPGTAWSWLETGWDLVPEARADEVTWSYDPMDPWHVAFTPGDHAAADHDRRRGRLRRRPADPGRRRRDPRQGPGAGSPPPRPPLTRALGPASGHSPTTAKPRCARCLGKPDVEREHRNDRPPARSAAARWRASSATRSVAMPSSAARRQTASSRATTKVRAQSCSKTARAASLLGLAEPRGGSRARPRRSAWRPVTQSGSARRIASARSLSSSATYRLTSALLST